MPSDNNSECPDAPPPGITRVRAEDLPKPGPASPERMARLARLAAMADSEIDYSDLPSCAGIVPEEEPIRSALARAMGMRHMGRAALWEAAKPHLPAITQEQVIDYLTGRAEVPASVVHAIVLAAGLRVTAVEPDEAALAASRPDARVA